MAINIDKQPLGLLISYQQVLEFASVGMRDHADQVEQLVKEGKVSRSYFDQLIKRLQIAVNDNNDIDTKIQKEIDKRLKGAFGYGATTPKILVSLENKLNKEMMDQAKLVEGRKKQGEEIQKKHSKPVKKMDTSISKEKGVKKDDSK